MCGEGGQAAASGGQHRRPWLVPVRRRREELRQAALGARGDGPPGVSVQVLAEGRERAAVRTGRAPAVAGTVGGEGALRGESRVGGRVATDGDTVSGDERWVTQSYRANSTRKTLGEKKTGGS